MSNRIPASPPVIAPLLNNENRPTWSVMIPVYNCAKFLEQTLKSVLLQDMGVERMQIEVVDDASTDEDIAAMVLAIGKGRISYFRQPENRGSLRNFETCINSAKGNYIHILHGDDFVEAGFYKKIEQLFITFPQAASACTGYKEIDVNGKFISNSRLQIPGDIVLRNWLSIIAKEQLLQPPAVVVKRSVYEQVGSFYAVTYGEDWEMWVRIASRFPVVHTPERLAYYRNHTDNISTSSLLTGQHIKDIDTVIRIIGHYLPEFDRKKIMNDCRRNWSHYFARTSDKTYGMYRKPKLALRQSFKAFRLHPNKTTLYYFIKTWIKVILKLEPRVGKVRPIYKS